MSVGRVACRPSSRATPLELFFGDRYGTSARVTMGVAEMEEAVDEAEWWGHLRATLLRMTRMCGVGSADAEDIVQQLLERFVSSGEVPAEQSYSEPRFLRQVCLNAVRSEYRARMRRHSRESAWSFLPEGALEPECALLEKEARDRCLVAIAGLSGRLGTRTVQAFMLCDVEGLSAPSAATILDVPEGTVRTWLRRARSQLTNSLKALEQTRAVSARQTPASFSARS